MPFPIPQHPVRRRHTRALSLGSSLGQPLPTDENEHPDALGIALSPEPQQQHYPPARQASGGYMVQAQAGARGLDHRRMPSAPAVQTQASAPCAGPREEDEEAIRPPQAGFMPYDHRPRFPSAPSPFKAVQPGDHVRRPSNQPPTPYPPPHHQPPPRSHILPARDSEQALHALGLNRPAHAPMRIVDERERERERELGPSPSKMVRILSPASQAIVQFHPQPPPSHEQRPPRQQQRYQPTPPVPFPSAPPSIPFPSVPRQLVVCNPGPSPAPSPAEETIPVPPHLQHARSRTPSSAEAVQRPLAPPGGHVRRRSMTFSHPNERPSRSAISPPTQLRKSQPNPTTPQRPQDLRLPKIAGPLRPASATSTLESDGGMVASSSMRVFAGAEVGGAVVKADAVRGGFATPSSAQPLVDRRPLSSTPSRSAQGDLGRQPTLLTPNAPPSHSARELRAVLGTDRRLASSHSNSLVLEQARGKARAEVDLVLESDVVVEGGAVGGRMEIKMHGDKVWWGLGKVRVVGFEDLQATETRHVFYHHAAPVLSAPPPGYGPPDDEGYYRGKEGTLSLPFYVRLPIGCGAKGPVKSKVGTIRYIVIGSVHLKASNSTDRSIAHFYRHVTIYPLLSPSAVLAPAPAPISEAASKALFLGGKGQVHLIASIHRPHWVAGQRCYVMVNINNETSKRVKSVHLTLTRTFTVFKPRAYLRTAAIDKEDPDACQTTTTRKKIAEETLEMGGKGAKGYVTAKGWWRGVDAGEKVEFSYSLMIPPDALTIPRSRLIEVSYSLRVAVSASLSTDVVVDIPVRVINFLSIDPPPTAFPPSPNPSPAPSVRPGSIEERRHSVAVKSVEALRESPSVAASLAPSSSFRVQPETAEAAARKPPRRQSLDLIDATLDDAIGAYRRSGGPSGLDDIASATEHSDSSDDERYDDDEFAADRKPSSSVAEARRNSIFQAIHSDSDAGSTASPPRTAIDLDDEDAEKVQGPTEAQDPDSSLAYLGPIKDDDVDDAEALRQIVKHASRYKTPTSEFSDPFARSRSPSPEPEDPPFAPPDESMQDSFAPRHHRAESPLPSPAEPQPSGTPSRAFSPPALPARSPLRPVSPTKTPTKASTPLLQTESPTPIKGSLRVHSRSFSPHAFSKTRTPSSAEAGPSSSPASRYARVQPSPSPRRAQPVSSAMARDASSDTPGLVSSSGGDTDDSSPSTSPSGWRPESRAAVALPALTSGARAPTKSSTILEEGLLHSPRQASAPSSAGQLWSRNSSQRSRGLQSQPPPVILPAGVRSKIAALESRSQALKDFASSPGHRASWNSTGSWEHQAQQLAVGGLVKRQLSVMSKMSVATDATGLERRDSTASSVASFKAPLFCRLSTSEDA